MSKIFKLTDVLGYLKLDLASLYLKGEPSQWFDNGHVSLEVHRWNQFRFFIKRNIKAGFEISAWQNWFKTFNVDDIDASKEAKFDDNDVDKEEDL